MILRVIARTKLFIFVIMMNYVISQCLCITIYRKCYLLWKDKPGF